MRSNRVVLGSAFFCLAFVGCSNAHEADRDSGALGGDAWVVDGGTDGGGEWCGPVQCGAGTSCCNASCGICTAPGVGCVDIECSGDAGPPTGGCGGIVARPCAPSEYCDYPDASFCGGDDEEGTCRPRPTDCPDPGGNRVCGCNGQDYLGDCAAYMAGTDIAHQGSCEMPPPPSSQASATQSCGPTDGPAWDFVITSGAPTCGGLPAGAETTIEIGRAIDESDTAVVFTIGGSGSQGSATACPFGVGGPPCFPLTGTVTFSSFHASVGAVFSYSLVASDGTPYTGSNVSVGTWCPGPPFCG